MALAQIPDGLKMEVMHYRMFEVADGYKPTLDISTPQHRRYALPCGGVTVVMLVDMNGNIYYKGSAICSKKDNYNKKIGRNIALQRALNPPKEKRVEQV